MILFYTYNRLVEHLGLTDQEIIAMAKFGLLIPETTRQLEKVLKGDFDFVRWEASIVENFEEVRRAFEKLNNPRMAFMINTLELHQKERFESLEDQIDRLQVMVEKVHQRILSKDAKITLQDFCVKTGKSIQTVYNHFKKGKEPGTKYININPWYNLNWVKEGNIYRALEYQFNLIYDRIYYKIDWI